MNPNVVVADLLILCYLLSTSCSAAAVDLVKVTLPAERDHRQKDQVQPPNNQTHGQGPQEPVQRPNEPIQRPNEPVQRPKETVQRPKEPVQRQEPVQRSKNQSHEQRPNERDQRPSTVRDLQPKNKGHENVDQRLHNTPQNASESQTKVYNAHAYIIYIMPNTRKTSSKQAKPKKHAKTRTSANVKALINYLHMKLKLLETTKHKRQPQSKTSNTHVKAKVKPPSKWYKKSKKYIAAKNVKKLSWSNISRNARRPHQFKKPQKYATPSEKLSRSKKLEKTERAMKADQPKKLRNFAPKSKKPRKSMPKFKAFKNPRNSARAMQVYRFKKSNTSVSKNLKKPPWFKGPKKPVITKGKNPKQSKETKTAVTARVPGRSKMTSKKPRSEQPRNASKTHVIKLVPQRKPTASIRTITRKRTTETPNETSPMTRGGQSVETTPTMVPENHTINDHPVSRISELQLAQMCQQFSPDRALSPARIPPRGDQPALYAFAQKSFPGLFRNRSTADESLQMREARNRSTADEILQMRGVDNEGIPVENWSDHDGDIFCPTKQQLVKAFDFMRNVRGELKEIVQFNELDSFQYIHIGQCAHLSQHNCASGCKQMTSIVYLIAWQDDVSFPMSFEPFEISTYCSCINIG